jgi:hypothetical protein
VDTGELSGEDSVIFWVRIFDYNHERDENDVLDRKGVPLDEYYLKDVAGGREEAKAIVSERFGKPLLFAKPKKRDGIYAIVMESEQFFYDRFHKVIDTYCFWHECHKPIKGKMTEFPRSYIAKEASECEFPGETTDEVVYFCSYDCKSKYRNAMNPFSEGEFQLKEAGEGGVIFGYIYQIYNRQEDIYYVGQTRFLPFFRWQEHVKSGKKGDIKDLSFSVLAVVPRTPGKSDDENQRYLNSVESWWIGLFVAERKVVKNISQPKPTIAHLKEAFESMLRAKGIDKQAELELK